MERIKERQRAEPILLELLETVVGSVHSPENSRLSLVVVLEEEEEEAVQE